MTITASILSLAIYVKPRAFVVQLRDTTAYIDCMPLSTFGVLALAATYGV